MLFLWVRALLLPLLRLWSVARIFWPVVAIPVVLFLVLWLPWFFLDKGKEIAEKTSPLVIVAVVTGLSVYLIYIFFAGIVQWHRSIVYENSVNRLRIIPRPRELRYFTRVAFFAIGGTVVYFIAASSITPALVYLIKPATPDIEYWLKFSVVFLCELLFGYLSRNEIAILPHIATTDSVFNRSSPALNTATSTFGWSFSLLVILLLPFTLAYGVEYAAIKKGALSFDGRNVPTWLVLTYFGITIYSALTFAALLSLFHKKYLAGMVRRH